MLHRQIRSIGLELPCQPTSAVHHLRRYVRIGGGLDLSEQQPESLGVATESDQVRPRETGCGSPSIPNMVPRPDHLSVAIQGEHRLRKRLAYLPTLLVTHGSKKLRQVASAHPGRRQSTQFILERLPELRISGSVCHWTRQKRAESGLARHHIALPLRNTFIPRVGERGGKRRNRNSHYDLLEETGPGVFRRRPRRPIIILRPLVLRRRQNCGRTRLRATLSDVRRRWQSFRTPECSDSCGNQCRFRTPTRSNECSRQAFTQKRPTPTSATRCPVCGLAP